MKEIHKSVLLQETVDSLSLKEEDIVLSELFELFAEFLTDFFVLFKNLSCVFLSHFNKPV